MLTAFPKSLAVLGGGTAGWLTAAYLDRTFNTPDRRAISITVVESAGTPRIGVGEATIPSLRELMAYLGVKEMDLVVRTAATLKHGIQFRDWSKVGETFFHAFDASAGLRDNRLCGEWLKRRGRGEAGRFSDETGIQARVAEAGMSPKRMLDDDYRAQLAYAYHLDAEALGDFLSELAIGRGCTRIVADVTDVELAADGDIAALKTADGRRISAELFIDCSGFASRLLTQAMGVAFESFADHLLCDRAVAIRAPRPDSAPVPPFTRARAVDAGWMWQIPLQTRDGTGYVYSSGHVSEADAEQALREAHGLGAELEARHIRMRVGRSRQAWVRNCVGVGLAAGFLEPLESTGIYLVEAALALLVRYFPLSGENPAARALFNREVNARYDELRDFLVAHYCLTQRDDTAFWRDVRRPEHIPPTLQERLEAWRDRMPSREDIPHHNSLFHHYSWQQIIYGMGWAPEAAIRNAQFWLPDRDERPMMESAVEHALANLPRHEVWLKGFAPLS